MAGGVYTTTLPGCPINLQSGADGPIIDLRAISTVIKRSGFSTLGCKVSGTGHIGQEGLSALQVDVPLAFHAVNDLGAVLQRQSGPGCKVFAA